MQLNQIVVKSAKSENFKQPKLCIEKSKRLELLLPEAKSRKDEKVNNMNDSGDDEEDEDDMEFPKTLEELLKKQWTLGADMIAEQSEKFEGNYFKIFDTQYSEFYFMIIFVELWNH